MARRKNTASAEDKAHAIEQLKRLCPPGTTVLCILRSVARSGMQRRIDLYVIDGKDLRWISGYASTAFGFRIDDRKEGIVMGGCGMEMGFALVSELSRQLYPEGFGCIGEGSDRGSRCPSNDHSNGDRDYTPHTAAEHLHTIECDGSKHCHWHKSGGYALKHHWL